MKKILILGHTGFVGTNVFDAVKNNQFEVIGASLQNGYDLRQEQTITSLLEKEKPEYIVNCMAHVGSLHYVTEFAGDVIRDNSRMILALYESIARVNPQIQIINPIANCGYPGDAEIYKESEWLNGPIHPSVLSYGNTRRLLVATSEAYNMQHKIQTTNYLVPNMYGEHDSTDPNKAHALNALISKFVKADAEGSAEISIWGSGKVVREWLYAADFARIVIITINDENLRKSITTPLNIAQNSGLSITELANIINSNFDNRFNLKYDTSKPDGAPVKVMDDTNFRKVFPEFTFQDFNEGIRRTVEYYKKRLPY